MFYTFGQNNSGGSFNYDERAGISHFVIVEADNVTVANARALGIGIYFDDDFDIDCECCGTRWYAQWDDKEGSSFPEYYGEDVTAEGFKPSYKWIEGPEVFVHYADGKIVGYGK